MLRKFALRHTGNAAFGVEQQRAQRYLVFGHAASSPAGAKAG